MNANYKSRTPANWLWRCLSAVIILTFGTSAFSQTPSQRVNGKIAFTSDRDGNLEIYVMNPDGTNQVRITSNNVVDVCPTWSPDGRKIAFVSQKQDGSFAIFTMNADGAGRTEVTALNGSRLVASDTILTRWRLLSWSPDGGRIAFHDYSDVSESIDIFIVNVDGSGRQNLTADHAHLDLTPVWSPDGSKILFSRYDMYEGYVGTMLHTINPDGTNLTRLLNGFADGWNEDTPDWSPFVNKIVYSVNRWDWVFDLYIANPDGTERQFFHGCDWTDNSCKLDALTPGFSPDGTKIVFSMLDFRTITPQKLYVKNLDGTGLMLLTDNGSSPSWQPLLSETCPNPIDCTGTFVSQHYRDFLNREADPDGLAFWTSQIASCGADQSCIEVRRITDSGSFFLSIEFQETGYLVYRLYKVAYGDMPGAPVPVSFGEFMPDTQTIGRNVIVKQAGWEQVLENNKRAFITDFVQRTRFTAAFVPSMSASEFVDKLNLNAGNPLSQTERAQLASDLLSGTRSRADVLRAVAEHPNVASGEFNRAFVLMQYFGYLRRNPNDAPDENLNGYNFWLSKLNQFNGNYIQAEMVKAFLSSSEYRQRFGQP